jgi:hypothetical protein
MRKCRYISKPILSTTQPPGPSTRSTKRQKSKGKLLPVHTMKIYSGCRGIAPLILNLGTRWRWVVNLAIRPLYLLEKPPYPLNRRLAGLQCRSGHSAEQNSSPIPEFEPLNIQPRTQSVYRLRYARSGWSVKIIALVPKLPQIPCTPAWHGSADTGNSWLWAMWSRTEECSTAAPCHYTSPVCTAAKLRRDIIQTGTGVTWRVQQGCYYTPPPPQYIFPKIIFFGYWVEKEQNKIFFFKTITWVIRTEKMKKSASDGT